MNFNVEAEYSCRCGGRPVHSQSANSAPGACTAEAEGINESEATITVMKLGLPPSVGHGLCSVEVVVVQVRGGASRHGIIQPLCNARPVETGRSYACGSRKPAFGQNSAQLNMCMQLVLPRDRTSLALPMNCPSPQVLLQRIILTGPLAECGGTLSDGCGVMLQDFRVQVLGFKANTATCAGCAK